MVKNPVFKTPDELLIALLSYDNWTEFIDGLYESKFESEVEDYYNGLFGILEEKGFVTVLYGDGRVCEALVTTAGHIRAREILSNEGGKNTLSFKPLVGKYRDDLVKILETYAENSEIPASALLTDSIKILRTNGYLSNFTPYINGVWGVSYAYADLAYPQLEKEYYEKTNSVATGITIAGGINQINYATGSATIYATQNNGIDTNKLAELINALIGQSKDLRQEDKQALNENVEIIQTELKSPKPKKRLIDFATKSLQAIGGSVEFLAAVATLVQFIQTVTSTLG